MFIGKRKIKKIRKSILRSNELLNNGTIKPLDEITVKKTNCYAYSLGIMYNADKDWYYDLGFTENSIQYYVQPDLIIEKTCKDLDNLEIKYRKIDLNGDKTLKDNEYLIKMFYKLPTGSYDCGDFHFIRQDKRTKKWFHKMGWYAQPEFVKDDNETHFEFDAEGEPKRFYYMSSLYSPLMYFAITEK